jgi:hypothetical protein
MGASAICLGISFGTEKFMTILRANFSSWGRAEGSMLSQVIVSNGGTGYRYAVWEYQIAKF